MSGGGNKTVSSAFTEGGRGDLIFKQLPNAEAQANDVQVGRLMHFAGPKVGIQHEWLNDKPHALAIHVHVE